MIKFSYYIKKDSSLEKLLGFFLSTSISLVRFSFTLRKINSPGIAVIALHKLGDTVFTVPAIKALQNEFGKNITIVCYEDSKKIYMLAFVDLHYLILSKEDFNFNGRIANIITRKKVKDLMAGTIVDLTGAINSASIIFNNRASKIAGFNEKYFKAIYTDYIPARKIPHQMDMYLDAAKLVVKAAEVESLKYFGKSLNPEGDILIHPFAGWKAKEWSFNKFVDLSLCLNKYHPCKLIIPKERSDEETISILNGRNISFIISKDITQFIEIIKQASIIIGCDSGAVNIASLLGKPTFIIYGPTNPKFHLPYGDQHDYIYKENEFSPKPDEKFGAGDAGRKSPGYDFMSSISVDEVYLKVISLYKKVFLKELENNHT